MAVSSCTAGLHLALAALGIGPGDEVILPTFTFCSTANVVVHLGARPVLVDVGGDGNLTLAKVEEAVTPQTRAIIPVHYGGQACDLAPLYSFAESQNIPLVEDAAHAAGSSYQDQKVGSDTLAADYPALTRVVVFSFYATKNLTTGEGGMVVTSDAALADKVRLLSLHGMSHDAWKRYTSAGSWYYEVVAAGYKYNMTDIQAAIGVHQLTKLDGFIKRRRQIARHYDRVLAELDGIDTLLNHPDRGHAYHLYPLRKLAGQYQCFVANFAALDDGMDDSVLEIAERGTFAVPEDELAMRLVSETTVVNEDLARVVARLNQLGVALFRANGTEYLVKLTLVGNDFALMAWPVE